jgi:sugar/nucleoside kinase (ribokinase family)
MKKMDVVVVGELNADLILGSIPSFPEIGKEKLAGSMTLTMGSASAIFATNIARLGLSVGFAGKLGKDAFGDVVLGTLKERGVNCTGIRVDPGSRTGLTVVMTFPHDYAMLTYLGAMESFSLKDVDFGFVEKARHMHLASYYLQPAMAEGCAELFSRAKTLGLTTSLDPGWDPQENWDDVLYKTLDRVDVFMPNENEALKISHQKTLDQALDVLAGHSAMVVVKRGSRGAVCRRGKEIVSARVFKVDPIDTTGAGDSFNAGFLSGWLAGLDLPTCMVRGSACGAIATTRAGGATASPDPKELEEFLKTHPEPVIE